MTNPGAEQTVQRRYVMGDELGGGGYGAVRRARDTLLDRDVAVKEVRFPSDVDPAERERFRDALRRETQAAASLNHPGAVTIFDVVDDDDDGRALIVMELVDAPTLAELVAAEDPLSPRRVASIGVDLLDTLVAAHEAGILHRDVKPSNVMVSESGRVRLSDFGVGAAVRSDGRSVSAYEAPEQRRGGEVGAPADLWALGATLYYAVEGQPPDVADPRPTARSGALGSVLRAVLVAAPEQRPSAYKLRQMLGRVASGSAAAASTSDVQAGSRAVQGREPATSSDTVDLTVTPAAVAVPPAPGGPDGPVVPSGPGPTVIPRPEPPAEPTPMPPEPPERPVEPTPAEPSAPPEIIPPTEPEPVRPPEPEIVPPVEPEVVPAVEPEIVPPVEPEIVPPAQPEVVPPAQPGIVPPAQPGIVPPEAPRASGEPRYGDRRPLLAVAAVAAAAILVALVLASVREDGPRITPPASTAPQAGSVDPSATSDAAVPGDWVAYTDPETGFAISHPPGWTIRRDGTRTDFTDPGSGAYMRVDHTDTPGPSPEGAWYDLEKSFSASNADYQRIRITPTTYAGFPAAIWEFTYSGGGAGLHASDLGFVTPRHGFALYAQSRVGDWDRMQPVFAQFRAAFKAPS